MSRPPVETAIIGAGAAGCFCGALLARRGFRVSIYESGVKPLAKVAVTGGGRCNLTNTFRDIGPEKAYPRGGRLMKRLLCGFNQNDTCNWFREKGVELVVQEDQCIFPKSQNAMQIVGTLLDELENKGARIYTGFAAERIEPVSNGFAIHFRGGEVRRADNVVVTVGGLSSEKMSCLFQGLDLQIVRPVPSLFTIKTDSSIRELTGTVVRNVSLRLHGSRFSSCGPLLITDWGFSGPATLKLSSYAARLLAENGYKGTLSVDWMPQLSDQQVMSLLEVYISKWPERQISSVYPDNFTSRLWNFIINKASIKENAKFVSLGGKSLRRLVSFLKCDDYNISGRARFKEEFVTCGGVDLAQVCLATLECKKWPNLYFAGEVLDIDAITGGFNLQAAWTTAYTVASAIAHKHNSQI